MSIPIPNKERWPETTDGTTDWESLFEDEHFGLLAAINDANTPAQLKQKADIIVRMIFTRENDQSVIDKVTSFLDKLIPDDADPEQLPVMQASIIKMLRKAKVTRIKRAVAYVEKEEKREKQHKPKKIDDRRPNRLVCFFRKILDSLALVSSLMSRTPKVQKPVADKKQPQASVDKDEEEKLFEQEAYVHDGGGDSEFQDSNMYDMKESESDVFKDEDAPKDGDEELESWDKY